STRNSTTCFSLLPAFSCSRIWRRRSSARSAFESASVWFWHTRQRSSAARSSTRFSSAGSSAAGGASAAIARPATSDRRRKSLLTLELAHERHEGLIEELRRHRADALVADDAALVDHVGLGHPVHAVVDAHPPVRVVEGGAVGVAVAGEPAHALGALVLVVQ